MHAIPGTGAAGGAAYGLLTMLDGRLVSGSRYVATLVGHKRGFDCDLLLTGEGRLDSQSLQGKACMSSAARARRHGAASVAIVGSTGDGAADCVDEAKGGFLQRYVSLADEFGEERAAREPSACIEEVAERIVREWRR
jgi:glycerate kinase